MTEAMPGEEAIALVQKILDTAKIFVRQGRPLAGAPYFYFTNGAHAAVLALLPRHEARGETKHRISDDDLISWAILARRDDCLTRIFVPSDIRTLITELQAARALSPSASDVPCRLCGDGAVGFYLIPEGCLCCSDHVQALCQQHIVTAESEGPIRFVGRPFGVRPSDGGEWNAAIDAVIQHLRKWRTSSAASPERLEDTILSLKRPPVPQEDDLGTIRSAD